MEIRLMGAELFHVDGGQTEQKEITKLIATYRNFANASNSYSCTCPRYGII